MWIKLKSLPAGPSAAFEGRRVRYRSDTGVPWSVDGFGDPSAAIRAMRVRVLRRVGPAERGYGDGSSWCAVDEAGGFRADVESWLRLPEGAEVWVRAGCNEPAAEGALAELLGHACVEHARAERAPKGGFHRYVVET